MITLLRIVYAIALALPILVYLVYPAVMRLLARRRPARPLQLEDAWPSVTIAIAAHNEEHTIERVVDSILGQEYPGPAVRILVGLDGCTDKTLQVLTGLRSDRLRWLELERAGKAATDNRLVDAADTTVVVTTAAGAVYERGALLELAKPFRDPSVGCVTGVFAPQGDGSAAAVGEGLYWRLEYALMEAESRLGVLACASGTAMAHRRSIFRPIPLDSDGDVSIAPNAAEQGYRVVFTSKAVVRDEAPADMRSLVRNRRRMALRALPTTASFVIRLVRRGRYGPAAALVMHKLLRWLVPWCLPLWLLTVLALGAAGDTVTAVVTVTVVGLLALAVAAAMLARPRLRAAVLSFAAAQYAFALATADVVRGRRARMWSRQEGAAWLP